MKGSGPRGRILPEDLERHRIGANIDAKERVEEIKIIGIRRQIAERMSEAKRQIPHFTYVEEVDVTELESLRADLNSHHVEDQPKLTLLAFFMRGVVKLIADFPNINAHYDAAQGLLKRFEAVHIGIATQTANGLIVPVVRHAEARDVWDSAVEVARVAAAARENKATKDELSGSTITITSLGKLGGIVSTPVINFPEVAIIGVNRIALRPVIVNGAVAVRQMMNLPVKFVGVGEGLDDLQPFDADVFVESLFV